RGQTVQVRGLFARLRAQRGTHTPPPHPQRRQAARVRRVQEAVRAQGPPQQAPQHAPQGLREESVHVPAARLRSQVHADGRPDQAPVDGTLYPQGVSRRGLGIMCQDLRATATVPSSVMWFIVKRMPCKLRRGGEIYYRPYYRHWQG
ncbi:hypothetical protein IscW_ISCW024482, partial [Ixodes scapularis]